MIVGVEVSHLLISTVLLSIGIGYCQIKKNIKIMQGLAIEN